MSMAAATTKIVSPAKTHTPVRREINFASPRAEKAPLEPHFN